MRGPALGAGQGGFAGRPYSALDMFAVCNSGGYDAQATARRPRSIVSLLYQPRAMHQRAISVMTNTPPRSAQSAPGGLQAVP